VFCRLKNMPLKVDIFAVGLRCAIGTDGDGVWDKLGFSAFSSAYPFEAAVLLTGRADSGEQDNN
jgi:hypothetical protein